MIYILDFMKSQRSNNVIVNHHNLDHFVLLAGALGIHSEEDLATKNYIISPSYSKDKYVYYIKTTHFELMISFYLKKNFVKINQLSSFGETDKVALKLLLEQVKHLTKSGYDYITLVADRDDKQTVLVGDQQIKPNGYIVWGKYSFLIKNSKNNLLMRLKDFRKIVKDARRDEKTLFDLLIDKHNGGVALWVSQGKAWLGRFSLGKGSTSRKRLSEISKKLNRV